VGGGYGWRGGTDRGVVGVKKRNSVVRREGGEGVGVGKGGGRGGGVESERGWGWSGVVVFGVVWWGEVKGVDQSGREE